MLTDKIPPDASDPLSEGEPFSALSKPDFKRTLRDLLVQDEVSDSDVEMLEKRSIDEIAAEEIDPEMCVECGDQVLPLRGWRGNGRERPCGAINAKNSFVRCVIIT